MILPENALRSHIAVLGKTGSGKSNLAKTLVEDSLSRHERVCVIDPTGTWYGLRLMADGATPSPHSVVIFGGQHGDLDIGQNHGAALARTIGTTATSAIVDTRAMTVSARTRFFTDFAETLIRENRGELTVVIDEAHLFMPQGGAKVGGGAPAMLHAGNNLVSLGRGVGLRIVLISQRPAKLHKDSLTQVETLVAMRLIAPQDRNAIREWIGEWAGEDARGIINSLPSLATGEAWIWAPEMDFLERVTCPLAATLDTGSVRRDRAEIELPQVDVDEIASQLEDVASEIFNDDPKRMRAHIFELEAKLSGKIDRESADRAYKDGYDTGRAHAAAKAQDVVDEMRRAIHAAVGYLLPIATLREDGDVPVVHIRRPPEPPTIEIQATCEPGPAHSPAHNPRAKTEPGGLLHPAGRKLLTVFAQHAPVCLTWAQACTLAGLKARGGHFNAGRKSLVDAGFIAEAGGAWRATDAGMAAAGTIPEKPQTADAMLDMWCEKLPQPAGNMLREIAGETRARGGTSWTKVASSLGLKPYGGHWNAGRKLLRDNGLVDESGDVVCAALAFME